MPLVSFWFLVLSRLLPDIVHPPSNITFVQDFEIDENSTEYLALHPMASMKQPSLVAEHFELLTEDEDQSLSDSDNSAASQSSGDEHSNGNRKLKKKPR